jgi:hypothetical protein
MYTYRINGDQLELISTDAVVFARVSAGGSGANASGAELGAGIGNMIRASKDKHRADKLYQEALLAIQAQGQESNNLHPSTRAEREGAIDPPAAQGTLQISSAPPGADIEVDGVFVGETPSTLAIKSGEHDIKVSKSGYQSWERKVRTSSGTVVINRELEKGVESSARQVVTPERLLGTQVSSATPAAVSDPPPQPRPGAAKSTLVSSATQVVPSEAPPPIEVKSAGELTIGADSDESPQVRHDGVTLSRVVAGGPADEAGMMVGDVVLALNNRYLYTRAELSDEIQRHPSGSRVPVRYQRRATIYDAYITIGITKSE